MNNVKKLVKERELLHLYIQRLEMENASLVNISNDNEASKLLTYSSQSPNTLEVSRRISIEEFSLVCLGSVGFDYKITRTNYSTVENEGKTEK